MPEITRPLARMMVIVIKLSANNKINEKKEAYIFAIIIRFVISITPEVSQSIHALQQQKQEQWQS